MHPPPKITNLFTPSPSPREQFFDLLDAKAAKLERIVSNGDASPEGFWYNPEQPEWVALIQGTAVLQFESGNLNLVAGDAVTIPAKMTHRVKRVSKDAEWLALHFSN